eukprot:4186074-Prymnesium_polylepis.2
MPPGWTSGSRCCPQRWVLNAGHNALSSPTSPSSQRDPTVVQLSLTWGDHASPETARCPPTVRKKRL